MSRLTALIEIDAVWFYGKILFNFSGYVRFLGLTLMGEINLCFVGKTILPRNYQHLDCFVLLGSHELVIVNFYADW